MTEIMKTIDISLLVPFQNHSFKERDRYTRMASEYEAEQKDLIALVENSEKNWKRPIRQPLI